jgi:hypothetical protein
MEIWILLLIVVAVAGAFIVRGVRSGLTGSPYPPDDQPPAPVNNSLTNWMAYNTMQQVDSTPASDTPSIDASSLSGNDSSGASSSDAAPQPDYSDQSGSASYAGDSSASGYDPSSSNGGSDGGGFGGGGGDSF